MVLHSATHPEVNNQLLGFINIEGVVVGCAPLCNVLPVWFLIIVDDTANYCCVVGKFDDGVGAVFCNAVVGAQCVELG